MNKARTQRTAIGNANAKVDNHKIKNMFNNEGINKICV